MEQYSTFQTAAYRDDALFDSSTKQERISPHRDHGGANLDDGLGHGLSANQLCSINNANAVHNGVTVAFNSQYRVDTSMLAPPIYSTSEFLPATMRKNGDSPFVVDGGDQSCTPRQLQTIPVNPSYEIRPDIDCSNFFGEMHTKSTTFENESLNTWNACRKPRPTSSPYMLAGMRPELSRSRLPPFERHATARMRVPSPAKVDVRRKRRREAHNLVEQRRRHKISEGIRHLATLVPKSRLEDPRVHKEENKNKKDDKILEGQTIDSNNYQPSEATVESTNPHKGDVLSNAVDWVRDLIWILELKLQQQDTMISTIVGLGGQFPFEVTEDEKRMQSELRVAKSAPGSIMLLKTSSLEST